MSFTKEQLAQRRLGLGASDAAAVMGMSPWRTPYQLFREKLGLDDDRDEYTIDNEALHLEMGHALEPVAIARFEKATHLQVIPHSRQLMVMDPKWPKRWVTLDGQASDKGLIEAKSVGFADPAEWGSEEEDSAVPVQYLMQALHGMACTDATHVWMPLIISNRQFRLYRISRDQEMIDMLTLAEMNFWDNVLKKEPPPAKNLEDLRLMFPTDRPGKRKVVDKKMYEVIQRHAMARQRESDAKADKEGFAFEIQAFMQDASELVLAEDAIKPILTWRKAKDSQVFDEDRFAQDHPDYYVEYQKTRVNGRRMLNKESGVCQHPVNRLAQVSTEEGSQSFCLDCRRII